ncbi:MAG: bifunctional glutamate--cysteine ligase GshA/glutathione synthetase GshB [Actinomycetia bacterium]|nr:bifunctional glutamate--cysteine ligase GshA/glutathione synthetase GshB [Actinomycetes bacterium]
MRQGEGGYHNLTELYPDYSSVEAYCASIAQFIEEGALREPKEYYAPIRIKPVDPEHSLESLQEYGIRYLEIRVLDVDPFDEAGISKEVLIFLERFVDFLATEPCEEFDERTQQDGDYNRRVVADHGLDPDLMLHINGKEVALRDQVAWMCEKLGLNGEVIPLAKRIHQQIDRLGFEPMMIDLAKKQQERAYQARWILPGYENWELSTQILIKEAIKRGLVVEPLDAHDNLIRITRKGQDAPDRVEYVMQATRTGADSYISPLLMNNKTVSKRILDEAGIITPRGVEFSLADSEKTLSDWIDVPAVIKPKSTNFGVGVTMFAQGAPLEALRTAARDAFEHDESILIETYIAGIEYRFLVIDGVVEAVLNRKPANVIGDGTSSIEELVALKNTHPYRSSGYRTPLNTIIIDDAVREFIARAGYTPLSVPEAGQTVFLRPNSNISTGGDSIDVTDQTDPYFKEIATRAAEAFDATFCGVDLIIEDLTDPASPYAVIEVNWNPAIHVHHFPEKGIERDIASKVLAAIGLI